MAVIHLLNEVKLNVQVKVNLSLYLSKHHAMETYWSRRCNATHSLILAVEGGELSPHTSAALTLEKETPLTIGEEAGWFQNRYGREGEEKFPQILCHILKICF